MQKRKAEGGTEHTIHAGEHARPQTRLSVERVLDLEGHPLQGRHDALHDGGADDEVAIRPPSLKNGKSIPLKTALSASI